MVAKKSSSFGLSCTDVACIIEVCAKNRVTSLTYGDLSIRFDLPHTMGQNIIKDDFDYKEEISSPEKDFDNDLVEAVLSSEYELEQLKLTDPYEWERLSMKDEEEHGEKI